MKRPSPVVTPSRGQIIISLQKLQFHFHISNMRIQTECKGGALLFIFFEMTCHSYIYFIPMLIKLLTLSFAITTALSSFYSGQFATSVTYIPLTYTTTTSNNYVTFTTTFTPLDSEAILVATTSPMTPSANIQDWTHLSPKSFTNYDYEGMVTGHIQKAWLGHPGPGVVVYFYLINLETQSRPLFLVQVSQNTAVGKSCATGINYYGSSFYCQSCSVSTLTGVYCSISHLTVALGQVKTMKVNTNDYALVTVNAEGEVSLSIGSNLAGVTLYFQYNDIGDEMAGVVNHIAGGVYEYTNGGYYTVSLANGGKDVSIGIINSNNQSATISVEYISLSGSYLMIIVIGVLGGLILLGIIIMLVVILKRSVDNRRQIHPNLIAVMPAFLQSSISQTLSNPQIEEYFPQIQKNDLFPLSSNNSFINLESEHECVICLCPIESAELIRVCYCKHIFHAVCLLEWFQKQQNCPYCRQNYTKTATLKLFYQLQKDSGTKLENIQIPRAIFKPKFNTSLQTLQVEDMEEFK